MEKRLRSDHVLEVFERFYLVLCLPCSAPTLHAFPWSRAIHLTSLVLQHTCVVIAPGFVMVYICCFRRLMWFSTATSEEQLPLEKWPRRIPGELGKTLVKRLLPVFDDGLIRKRGALVLLCSSSSCSAHTQVFVMVNHGGDWSLSIKLMRDIVTAFALVMHWAAKSEYWQGCEKSLKNVISDPKSA